jgi:hypothetical protein
MRNVLILFALTVTFLSAAMAPAPVNPPTCGDHCPWLQPAAPAAVAPTPVNPPTCGDHCPWLH